MVNAYFNWGSIIGILLVIWGLIAAPAGITQLVLYFQNRKLGDTSKILRLIYLLIVTPSRFIGSIFVGASIFLQGWRLDPILITAFATLTGMYLLESSFGIIRDLIKWFESRR